MNRLSTAAGLACLLAIAWWAYFPGLAGGFLFDDFVNLDKLASPGPVDNWPAFWRYITSGTADPLGRPMALLTFLLDGHDWPTDPAPFLRTNVLLHLANGVLLFLLVARLERRFQTTDTRRQHVALLATGIWLLHPLLVSTTLYVVQREAMLPATFTLLGLLAYLHGRERLEAGVPARGNAWMVGGLAFCTVLATLSKANGILLPLLAWTLESTVLCRTSSHRLPRWTKLTALVLPSAATIAYLLSLLPRLAEPLPFRGWTIGQRLLTEPRVLLDYLQLLAVPRVLSTGLYNDGYEVSRGWLAPPETLPALLAIIALASLALLLRRRFPPLSAALCFFFAGHLLESSSVPLELYFEHRNYLPALLLGWPLARAICLWRAPYAARGAAAALVLALLAITTWQRAALWADGERMPLLWAAGNPASARAQAVAAMVEIEQGDATSAKHRLAPLWKRDPYNLQLALNMADAACAGPGLLPSEIAGIGQALARAREGHALAYRWLEKALAAALQGNCSGLDLDTIDHWLAAAWRNPLFSSDSARRQDLLSLRGRVQLARKNAASALASFDRALIERPGPAVVASQTAMLAGAGYYREALAHLERYQRMNITETPGAGMPRLHAWVLRRQGYWPHEFAELRRKLRAELISGAPRAVNP